MNKKSSGEVERRRDLRVDDTNNSSLSILLSRECKDSDGRYIR
jgi:hypothetical protein